MTAPAAAAPTVLDAHFDDLEQELASTRRLLERFPDQHADWKPHEKSMSLAQLAAHVAELPGFAGAMLATDELDMMAGGGYTPPQARTREAVLALHDRSAESVLRALREAPHEKLHGRWVLRGGDTVYLDGRRGRLLRETLVSHIAHHRGQLSVYYRMLGVPVPGMYGPSADEA